MSSDLLTTDPAPASEVLTSGNPTPDVLKRFGLLTPAEHDRVCERESTSHSLVEGLIQARSVSVLIGDSGIGKSPLVYQLGLSVAAGMPFLGLTTQPGLVVYADHENGPLDSRELRDNIARFLRLSAIPGQFLIWPETGEVFNLEGISRELHPKLIIIDSLRSFDPDFEKSDNTGRRMKEFRRAAYKYNISILAIHHVKKPGQNGPPRLENDVLMHWLKTASGHSAIINQSDTRIAAALPDNGDSAMLLRWHRRIHGESGPIYLNRVLNDAGEPIGYRPMEGPELLSNPDQQNAFANLPDEFSFHEAKRVYGRTDDPTRKWLKKCEGVGIVEHVGRGQYRKTWPKR